MHLTKHYLASISHCFFIIKIFPFLTNFDILFDLVFDIYCLFMMHVFENSNFR